MASSGHNTPISQEEESDDSDAASPTNPRAYLSESPITPPPLMPVKEVQGDPCVFMDNYEPIRYLGLCCEGSLQLIEELASHGRSTDDHLIGSTSVTMTMLRGLLPNTTS